MFHKIARVVKTFSYMLLNWQGQFLQKRLVKRMGYDGKKVVKGCTLELTQDDLCDKTKLEEEVCLILKTCKNDSEAVVKFFEQNGVKVFRINNASKVLGKIHERDGLITERTGLAALYLNFITAKIFGLKSGNMVVVENEDLNIHVLIKALHKWVALKNGLPGLDAKSQKLLRRFDVEKDDDIIGRLSLKEIDSVRAAIARDTQAIDFVIKYTKEHAGAKNALDKIKNEGGANI